MAKTHGRVKSLAEQIADLEDPTPKDFDPEDINDRAESSDDQSSGSEYGNANAGREHYIAVGKSKLRKPEKVSLGRQYTGSRISREALEGDESENDPFVKASSDEDAEGLDDELDDSKNGLKMGGESNSDAESDEELDGVTDSEGDHEFRSSNDDDDGEDDQDGSGSAVSGDEDEEDEDEDEEKGGVGPPDDRAEIRRLMASDHKTVAASLSQAAKADASKGGAVKMQRSAFGALLNARIKLQKGITYLNGLPSTLEDDSTIDEDSIKSAEAAALALWSTIEDLRHVLSDAQISNKTSSKKRKRAAPPSISTSSADIWNRMEAIEAQSRPHRRAVLDKWASKTRGSRAALPNARGKLMNHGATDQQTMSSVLDAHIATELDGRVSKRTRTEEIQEPRQSNGTSNATHDLNGIYDDSIFYQSLLRDLVEERMSTTNNGVEALQMQLPSRLAIHPTTGMRKDKIKRPVDTKASKGRKMRYTVHEKLQNFMPPEDRCSWGDRAREEFFASLLGRSAREVLGEDDEDEDKLMEEEEDIEEGGLRLFRS
ncbi:hypothetical protein AJ78_05032 [Emergomyces pasteurianus Ep9510]|uniref:Protein BFR2 n=1 Tax=Emergomyces pasteurianus Ep9510 TaxID=1447872 RepID=A0A1J9Q358_9EURO|nr:hypothetical protein AJ78_05032 [Emergomyces pasteurianus Ep9510]